MLWHGVWLAALAATAFGAVASCATAADTSPPVIGQVEPKEGGFVNAELVGLDGVGNAYLFALITDDTPLDAPRASARILRADDGFEVAVLPVGPAPSQPGALALEAVAPLADGAYRLVVEATDRAGNLARAERNFTVDTDGPRLAAFAPAVSKERAALLLLDASDNLSGFVEPFFLSYRSACAFSWSEVPVQVTLLPGRAVGQALLTLCEGSTNQYSVTAVDRAGNTVQILQRKITYDTHPPGFTKFAPGPFERVDESAPTLEVWVTDHAAGVNRSSVEAQVSGDGGVTWGPWRPATTEGPATYLSASVRANFTAGATAAVRWRASDLAGNGPSTSEVRFFYLNGPPFVVSFEPAEGAEVFENSAVRLFAEFADPDADTVVATVTSDLDGLLGRADGRRVHLSPGPHTLTLEGDDGHGHRVTYSYQVQVVARPPPDLRPLLFTLVIAGAMVWAAYATWTREGEEDAPPAAKS